MLDNQKKKRIINEIDKLTDEGYNKYITSTRTIFDVAINAIRPEYTDRRTDNNGLAKHTELTIYDITDKEVLMNIYSNRLNQVVIKQSKLNLSNIWTYLSNVIDYIEEIK